MNVSNNKLDYIQMLRGFAALFVVIYHMRSIHFNGAFGVDMFFVISGFIMMYISQNRVEKFFLKRVLRIVPLYYLYTLLWVALLIIIPTAFNTTTFNMSDLIKSLLFIPYYAENRSHPVLNVGWTLNYEMFFYLIFGVSMFVNKKARGFICSIIIIFLVLLGKSIETDDVIFNTWTNTILLEFIFGILAFYICRYLCSKVHDIANIYKFIALMFFCVMIIFMSSVTPSIYRFALWGVPSLIVFVATYVFTVGYKIPKFLVRLGDISFSLYLLHTFVIQSVDHIIHPLHNEFDVPTLFFTLLTILLCIFGSYWSWYFFERTVAKKLSEWFCK